MTLEDEARTTQYAHSGAPVDEIDRLRTSCASDRRIHLTGHTVLQLPAGSVLQLVNRSGDTVVLRAVTDRGQNSYSASLTVLGLEVE